MVQIFAFNPSAKAGHPIELRVEPDRRFQIALYRQGAGSQLIKVGRPALSAKGNVVEDFNRDTQISFLRSQAALGPAGGCSSAWQWPWVQISTAAVTGVYFAIAYEVDPRGLPVAEMGHRVENDGPVSSHGGDGDSMALFVVTPRSPGAEIAYIVPVATYHAYNIVGGGCFYEDRLRDIPAVDKVTWRRPGGGTGETGVRHQPADPHEPATPRQIFAHWDAPMIRFLLENHYNVAFYTDLDLDAPAFADTLQRMRTKAVVSAGHHEYWSDNMRRGMLSFVLAGGHYACFSGNTCYWKVGFDGAEGTMTKIAPFDGAEADLLGTSWTRGAGRWGWVDRSVPQPQRKWTHRDRPAIGYTVKKSEHWAFECTQLANEQIFGAAERLVGYECDGPCDRPLPGLRFETLASAPLNAEDWAADDAGECLGPSATMRVSLPVGQQGYVFNAATTDWPRILMADPPTEASRITRQIAVNVLKKFGVQPSE
jgi:hypothetical protein